MDKSEQILELIAEMNNKMDDGFNKVNEEFGKVYQEFGNVYSIIKDVRIELKSEINDIKMTLENETNKNIRVIAEGHSDLSNKLDKALKIENEKELFLIRLNILESEVERIKARLN